MKAAPTAFFAGIVACASVSAPAAAGSEPGVDRRIEKVRESVLAVQRDVATAAQSRDNPDGVSVYLRRAGSNRGINRVRVAAGDKYRIDHVNRGKSDGLPNDGGLTRRIGTLAFQTAETGVSARATVRKGTDSLRIEGRADFAETPLQANDIIELVVREGGVFTDARLDIVQWHPDASIEPDNRSLMSLLSSDGGAGLRRFRPGSRQDPRVRNALRLAAAGEPAAGVNRLLRLRERLPASGETPDALLWALAETSLEADLAERAQRVLAQLADRDVDAERLARLQLRLGEIQLARGHASRARRYLEADSRQPPPGVRLEWQALMVRVRLASSEPESAAAVFDDEEALIHVVRRKLDNPGQANKLAAYARYNRAIALIRSGKAQQGRTWLDIVGRMATFDAETRALRDTANAALGWQLLRTRQGLTAGAVFNRVRLDGRSSDAALLGAGWALLSQAGHEVKRSQGDQLVGARPENSKLPEFVVDALIERGILDRNVYGQQSLRASFSRSETPEDKPDAARRALQYWLDLSKRDIRSAPVQEGLLAIPLAFRLLDDKAEAAKRYRAAAERLEQAGETLAAAERRIGDDAWLSEFLKDLAGSDTRPVTDPQSPRAWVRRAALADTDLRAAERRRSLRALERRITTVIRRMQTAGGASAFEQSEKWRQRLNQAQASINELRTRIRERMRAQLGDSLARRQDRLRGYLEAAYRGVASITGNLPEQAPDTAH